MADLKQQLIDLLVKLKILKDSDGGAKTPKQKVPKTPKASNPNKVAFADAWKNFADDVPNWGDHLKNIGSWPQDKQIAFACVCLGVVLILVGAIIQIL